MALAKVIDSTSTRVTIPRSALKGVSAQTLGEMSFFEFDPVSKGLIVKFTFTEQGLGVGEQVTRLGIRHSHLSGKTEFERLIVASLVLLFGERAQIPIDSKIVDRAEVTLPGCRH